jgi:lysophospholipase L1-like esterase
MRFGLIVLASIFLASCVAEKPKTTFETVIVEGRALHTDEGIRLSFPGNRLRLATDGNALQFTIAPGGNVELLAVDIRTNGDDWGTVELDRYSPLTIFIDSEDNEVEVDIIRRNEAWQGDIILTEISSRSNFIDPTPFPKTKLLFIGDSITAGTGTQSRINDAGQREAVSNARLAYPRVLGNRLNAQIHQVAYGGRGLLRDWQGITDTNNAPQFYDRVLPDNPDHLWDPADYQADIVSVMLGTNDFNTGIPDRESWVMAYKTFVARIRKDYPKAQIFLISSPMTGGEKGETLKAYVQEVAQSFETPLVRFLEVGLYEGEFWDSHPTAAEHEKIADDLEADFQAALNRR